MEVTGYGEIAVGESFAVVQTGERVETRVPAQALALLGSGAYKELGELEGQSQLRLTIEKRGGSTAGFCVSYGSALLAVVPIPWNWRGWGVHEVLAALAARR